VVNYISKVCLISSYVTYIHYTYILSLFVFCNNIFINTIKYSFNSEYRSQPKHFLTLDDLLYFLENLGKKGATMNPHYTQKDLKLMYEDFHTRDVGHSDDPLGAFIHRHAVRLGLREPGNI